MELNRRGFLASVLTCVGLIWAPKQATTKDWTLDDLQYGADYLYQHYAMNVNRIICSHKDRRRLLSLNYVTGSSYVEICAEKGQPDGKFFMLDTTETHLLFEYDAANRTFR